LAWTIFRPSVIFGPGDGFMTTLARLVRRAPVVPVIGNGESKFQPIAVDQVALAYERACRSGDRRPDLRAGGWQSLRL
jgi:NADH dehydrogenase